ncbi:MAG: hypothetical protein KGJ09_04930 [Candidatus Omnitrophica bacterium]|nr:hypothetical protein [Candidatus Omnitrophota bacterium]MDE2009407.1 hypothetical protein [Candidatus Omnitrophota bacterium]MDE2214191.1 hypothetical protein [Candidatus Omnitrophota bacterium]MDE2231228.1 hypothetical protein [Candidatus Omnitrophota bacterium]
MSARFLKILAGVVSVHFLGLSLLWVGFFTPLPRYPVLFVYEGELPPEDVGGGAQGALPKEKISYLLTVDHHTSAYFNRWTSLRDPSKPPLR